VVARLKNHTLWFYGSQINVTLDNNTATFPLNQRVYFDFTHDTNIIAALTAFGLKQCSTSRSSARRGPSRPTERRT
jgi:hypothetical protein